MKKVVSFIAICTILLASVPVGVMPRTCSSCGAVLTCTDLHHCTGQNGPMKKLGMTMMAHDIQ